MQGARTGKPLWIAILSLAISIAAIIFHRPAEHNNDNLWALTLVAPPADGSCMTRDRAMSIIESSDAPWELKSPRFCTDRPDITDWVSVQELLDTRFFAFDAQGCLAEWKEAPC